MNIIVRCVHILHKIHEYRREKANDEKKCWPSMRMHWTSVYGKWWVQKWAHVNSIELALKLMFEHTATCNGGERNFCVRAISPNGGRNLSFRCWAQNSICAWPTVTHYGNVQQIHDENERKIKQGQERMPRGWKRKEPSGMKREKQPYQTVHSAKQKKNPTKKASKSWSLLFGLAKCIPLEISSNSCEIEQFSRALCPIEAK